MKVWSMWLRSAAVCGLAASLVAACSGASTSDPGAAGPDGGDGPDGGEVDAPSGSKDDAATTNPDGATVPSGPDTIQVLVEPTDNAQALLAAIQGAKSSVHMTMYLMNDKRFIAALIAQHKAGRDVKVLLNQTFPGGAGTNQPTFSELQMAGVAVAWAPSTFALTHEKCVVIDGAQAWIMTMNLQTTSSSNREFLAVDTQAADVKEADAMFAADFANTPFTPSGDLLVAPVNARDRLVALIKGAKTSVDLEGEELSDTTVVATLVAAKNAGATVRVVLADNAPSASQSSAVIKLKAASIPVVKVASPYIHAKAIVVDGARAYVGSENFTTGSLQYNRELGIITTNASSAGAVSAAIAQDFAAGTAL